MLLVDVAEVAAFDVLGVRVRPLFGPLDLDYPDLDARQFDEAMTSRPPGAAASARQGVVVQEPAGHVLAPHYHGVPQFQVFHAGRGRLGATEVGPVAVHYSDGGTPYGPIVAGPDGLDYAVLRPCADVGAHWMPAERGGVVRGGRHFTVHLDLDAADAADGGAVLEPPSGRHPAAVEWRRMQPGATFRVPAAGQTDVDLALALVRGGLVAPAAVRAPSYGHASEATVVVQAGAEGADLLLLRMPRASPLDAVTSGRRPH